MRLVTGFEIQTEKTYETRVVWMTLYYDTHITYIGYHFITVNQEGPAAQRLFYCCAIINGMSLQSLLVGVIKTSSTANYFIVDTQLKMFYSDVENIIDYYRFLGSFYM